MTSQGPNSRCGWGPRDFVVWEGILVTKATHVVEFKRQEVPKDMVGKEPTDLSTSSYGATEAWLLLEPAAAES